MEWADHLLACGWERRAVRPNFDPAGRPGDAELWAPPEMEAPAVALVSVAERRLPKPERLFGRYLDVPLEVRRVLSALSAQGRVDFCMVSDGAVEFWYDAAHDACLGGEARPGSRLRERVWACLPMDQARAGQLESAMERPVQKMGDDLATWVTLWVNELGSAIEALDAPATPTPTDLKRFFMLLGLALKTVGRLAGAEPIEDYCARVALATEGRRGPLLRAAIPNALAWLEATFPGKLTGGAARDVAAWLTPLFERRADLVERLAGELPCVSVAKTAADALVEALGDPRAEMVAWRQTVTTQLEQLERSLHVEGRHVLNPIVIDVDREGLGWLLHCARWAVRYWKQRIESERDAPPPSRNKSAAAVPAVRPPAGMAWQLDLTVPWPAGVNEDGRVENILLYALGNSLRVRAGKPFVRLAAELLLFALSLEETSEEPQELPTPLDLKAIWI